MAENKEIWVPVIGLENYYQVSSFGSIKYLAKTVNIGMGRMQDWPEKIKSVFNVGTHGYYTFQFQVEKKSYADLVHRLVALHFVPNPENYPWVNHLDGNKLNCRANNLEWATPAQNNLHAYRSGLKIGAWTGVSGNSHPRSKPVLQFDTKGEFIQEWGSACLAAKAFNVAQSNISAVCLGIYKTCQGYFWQYK